MSSVCQAWEENMQILHVSILSWIKSSKVVADKGIQIFTARGRGRGRKEEWCDHSRNSDRCVCERERGRQAGMRRCSCHYLWRWRWWREKRTRAQPRWRDAARSGNMKKRGLSAFHWKRWRATTDTASAANSCSTVSYCVFRVWGVVVCLTGHVEWVLGWKSWLLHPWYTELVPALMITYHPWLYVDIICHCQFKF